MRKRGGNSNRLLDDISVYKILLGGFCVGAVYWVVDSLVDAYVFRAGSFISQLFTSSAKELWVRLLAMFLFVFAGVFAQIVINRHKRTERKLSAMEQDLSSAFDNAAIGMIMLNLEGKFIRSNKTFCRMVGYSEEEIVNRSFNEISYPDDHLAGSEAFHKLLKGEISVVNIEKRYIHKDGHEVNARITASVIYGKKGEPLYVFSQIEDISERKESEKLIERLNRQNQLLLEAVGEGVYGVDVEGRTTFVNPAAAKMLGWEAKELTGRVVHAIIHHSKADGSPYPAEECRVYEAFRKGAVSHAVGEVFWRKDGTSFSVEYVSTPLMENYKVVGAVIVFRDITERQKTEEELKKYREHLESLVEDRTAHLKLADEFLKHEISERRVVDEALKESDEKFRAIAVAATDGIVVMDNRGIISYWNPAAERMFGYSAGETTGKELHMVLAPERFHDAYRKGFERFRDTGHGFVVGNTVELFALRKDGAEFPIEVSVSKIRIKGQWHAVGIIRDITERKRMQEEALKADKLESLGILAGGLAHDFNNILTGILGNISLAKMHSESSMPVHDRLLAAEKASMRAKDLTQQLLTFSKGGRPVKKTISLVDLVRDSAGFALSGSMSRCDFSLPADLWYIEADEGQTSQVIQNIIINADHAMPEGGIVKVGAENLSISEGNGLSLKAGKYVKIFIEDSGIGMPEEHIQKIFDPYFTTKQKGSGLGLATSYSIVRNHGGLITVQSRLGEGTTFYVYLPATTKAVSPRKGEKIFFFDNKKILLMDDEETIKDTAGKMLEKIGCKVMYATDGSEAVEMYNAAKDSGEQFDAVIMDLTVPGGMGGAEAVKKLLAIDHNVRVIVSSGYSDSAVMSKYREHGFVGCISKPYKIEELSLVLNRALED